MFEQPSPRINVRALIRDILEEEQELLTMLGQDFLAEHRQEVETRLDRWHRYLENHYPDGELPPRGDAGRLRTYQIELALTMRMIAESHAEPFPVVHQRMLKQAQHRVKLLANRHQITDSSLRTTRYEARLEQELLIELWAKWHMWLSL